MNFKIDTKEKFQQITILESHLTANMTDDLEKLFNDALENPVKNTVLSLQNVNLLDTVAAIKIAAVQQTFYEHGASFVICDLQPPVKDMLDASELLETMNVTPSLSEAWDIVQMEEIEREFMNDL